MNCKIFNNLLPGYLYGEASIEEREVIRAHARDCPDCRRLLDEMAETVSLLREERKDHFSRGEMAALRMRVKEEIAGMDISPVPSSARPRLRFFSRPILLPAAGALIAASIVAVLLYHPVEAPVPVIPAAPSAAEELVTMTETIEEEYDSVGELCREMDELQQLFFTEPDSGLEAETRSNDASVPV